MLVFYTLFTKNIFCLKHATTGNVCNLSYPAACGSGVGSTVTSGSGSGSGGAGLIPSASSISHLAEVRYLADSDNLSNSEAVRK